MLLYYSFFCQVVDVCTHETNHLIPLWGCNFTTSCQKGSVTYLIVPHWYTIVIYSKLVYIMMVYQCGDGMSRTSTLCSMWSGAALSVLWCYFEVSLGLKKKQKEIRIACWCMCDVQTSFPASSCDRERDVGKINEKQCSRADLIGGWCVCMLR